MSESNNTPNASYRKPTVVAIALGVTAAFLLIWGNTLYGSFVGTETPDVVKQVNPLTLNQTENNQNTMNEETSTSPEFNDITVTTTEKGSGEAASSGDEVTVHYVLTVNDEIVDTSYVRNEPFSLTLGAGMVIEGWEKGLLGAQAGEQRQLVVQPSAGYGEAGTGHPLSGQILNFDIRILSVDKG